MRYTMSIPCRPRRVNGVDENLEAYKWCRKHLYDFTGYRKFFHPDGTPGWCWMMEKVLTDREEQIAAQSYAVGRWKLEPKQVIFAPESSRSGISCFVTLLAYLAAAVGLIIARFIH